MRSSALLSLAALAAAQCPPATIITARGSGEPQGVGALSSLVDLLVADRPGTTVQPVVYPATLTDYAISAQDGALEVQRLLRNFTAACPEAQIVLIGYSQGAHVLGDALCGGGLLNYTVPPLELNVADQVDAVVWYGDPRFVSNATYSNGTSNANGFFPRPENVSCEHFADHIVSYCDDQDRFCGGGTDLQVHLTYPERYNEEARDFVNGLLDEVSGSGNATPAPSNSTSPGNSTTHPSQTSGMPSPTSNPPVETGAAALNGVPQSAMLLGMAAALFSLFSQL